MAAIDEARGYFTELKKEGSIRTDLPPGREEKYFNPVMETMPRDRVLEMRDKRLRFLVKWAYEKTQFYRKMWDEAKVSPDEIKGYDDLEKLPFFRKSGKWGLRIDQREKPPYGTRIVEELIPYLSRVYLSTGTTGTATYIPWIREEWEAAGESWARKFSSYGVRPGSIASFVIPIERNYIAIPGAQEAASRIGAIFVAEGVVKPMTDPKGFIADILATARDTERTHRPYLLYTSPSIHTAIGNAFARERIEPPFDGICFDAEPVSKERRDELRRLFPKAKTITYGYTTSEIISGGDECPESAIKDGALGWHQREDLNILEVVNPETGKRVPKGQRGELLFTSLANLATPIIRFSVEDVHTNDFDTDVCECSRTHLRWKNHVFGRTMDVFTVKGKDLLPFDISKVMPKIPEAVGPYQVIADAWDMDVLKIRLETARDLPDEEYKNKVRNIFQDALGVPVEPELVPRATLLLPGRWKIVALIDNRPKKE
jgi:phenylacetate-coenzyme A ligase PaaK-like adenylate-forming protein